MNILACGTGRGTTDITEICLARGVKILAYVDVDVQSPERVYQGRGRFSFYRVLKRFFDAFGWLGQTLYRRLSVCLGFWGTTPSHIPDGYLYPERLEGKTVIRPSQVTQYEFDYIVIAHLGYEQFRLQFMHMGVPTDKILSLVSNEQKCLRKLGNEKFLVHRGKRIVDGKPQRVYETFGLEGPATQDIPPLIDEGLQYPLVDRLISSCRLALKDLGKAPSALQPGANWAGFLKQTRRNFLDLMEKHDVHELTRLLNNFLRNPLSTGIFGGEEAFVAFKRTRRAGQLSAIKDCYKPWKYTVPGEPNLMEVGLPPIGNPYGYRIGGAMLHPNAFLGHYRANFCAQLVKQQSVRPVIAEIGGGVGLVGYYLLQRGRNLVYIDFDLPENLFVASYFLSMAYPEKRILYYKDAQSKIDQSVFSNFDIVLMPNFMVQNLDDLSVDLFVNTISFSEMDYENIVEYMRQIERTCKTYFYHENLADFDNSYKNYPSDFFPIPSSFEEIMRAPSRWPFFSLYSTQHMYIEALYRRRKEDTP